MSAPTVQAEDLHALLGRRAPVALLDLRERGAFERGHIFRATPLPRRLLEARLPALITCPRTPVVLCDADGSLSALAAPTPARMGYRDVSSLAGGIAGWRGAGRHTVQGVNVPSKVFGERVLHELKTPEISPEDLQARMAAGEDLVIVDARTPEEYARGCLPGAWSVPGGELVLRIGELIRRPETTIVVHCGGRTRSYLGAESLRRMRLPNPIVAVRNGTMGWALAGFELERGAARRAPPVSAKSRALASVAAKRVALEEGVPFLAPEEVRRRWERRESENIYLFDVRTVEEYAAGHVAGAVWAPGGQLVQATDEYIAVDSASIVLICDGFVRSAMTAAWLRRMGLGGVAVLAGGLPAWQQSRGAVETGRPTPIPWGYEAARAATASIAPGASVGDALVLSVDPSDVYARGHVPGAGWICRSRLEPLIAGIAPDRQRPIVMTCADGLQSTLAGATLAGLGYTAARVLEGGMRAWVEAGLPVESGLTRLLDQADDVVLKPYDRGRAAMEAYLRWEEALDAQGRSPHSLLPETEPRS
jgi:rhodanese-related sulfurtransferase